MFTRSVSFRLVLFSVAWLAIALVAGGIALSQIFRAHVENTFDNSLYSHIEELLAFSIVTDGNFAMRGHPSDPDYVRPLSGWYWEIAINAKAASRSRSLWDQELDLKNMPRPNLGELVSFSASGPRGEPIRISAETFTLPGLEDEITIYASGPASEIEKTMEEFNETLTLSLLALGLGMAAAVLLQVVLGLRPLKLMQSRLHDIHAGRAERMVGDYPSEVEPLVKDLNILLENNAAVIARARTHAGNLAHALKTPLAILQNEAANMRDDRCKMVNEQIAAMNELITRHLSRARAAGGVGVPGLVSDIDDIIMSLKRTLERIYIDRKITISIGNMENLKVAGERQDMEEMLGNLMDNACKWANKSVKVSTVLSGVYGLIIIEDDGPGVPDDKLAEILHRGKRLDEATPGSGLGLSIVTDLAELYNGALELGHSDLGGMKATLKLPLIEGK
ncbi:MAG: ATP-binding protein [Rhodospirillaceae bacterium]|nr:ATP-binding protein [Rhodospirillaceae bacterium]